MSVVEMKKALREIHRELLTSAILTDAETAKMEALAVLLAQKIRDAGGDPRK